MMLFAPARVPRLSFLLAATVALFPLGSRAPRVLADREVTVAEGDTLTSIALAYFGDAGYAQQLADYNHIAVGDSIRPGQTLKIPDSPAVEASVLIPPPQPQTVPVASAEQAAPRAGPIIQTGLATWYGPGFEGSRTKCGQIFHDSDLTASSNDLPCGTIIQVTDLENGHSVVVTVDDTGGFRHPNILDLSGAAFRSLDSQARGVIQVSIAQMLD